MSLLKSRKARIAKKLGIALAFLILTPAVIYLVGVNGLLNTSYGLRIINCRPDIVQVHYASVWSVWPGRIHVKAADISGQDARVQFEVTADEAAITFSPRGIFNKVVNGHEVRGHGFTVRLRRRLPEMPSVEEMAKLPAINFFASPLTDDLPERLIGVRLEDVDVQELREVWVDAYRFVAGIDLKASFFVRPERMLDVYPAVIALTAGTLTTGARVVATAVHGTISGTVDHMNIGAATRKSLSLVSASIDLGLGLDSVAFLNDYFPDDSKLRLADGSGDLALNVGLERGVVSAGSTLDFTSERIHLTVPSFKLGGTLHLVAGADANSGYASFTLELGTLALVQRSDDKTYVRSKIIRLRGHTTDLDLVHPQDVDVHLDVPDANVADFTFLNNYIPEGTAARVDAGSGKLQAHFNLSTAKQRVDGAFDVEGSNLSVKNNSAHLRGGARIHGVVNHLDLVTLGADLSGTWLALDDVTIRYDKKDTPNWSARVELASCQLHPNGHHKLEVTAHVKLKNLQPVMGVISANISLPWIAKALSDRENVKLRAHVDLAETSLSASDLSMDAGQLSMRGQLRITDLHKAKPLVNGSILLALGALAVGLDLHDSAVKAILYRPTHWYEQKTALIAQK